MNNIAVKIRKNKDEGIKESKSLFAITGVIILVIYTVSLLLPLSWAMISSLKTRIDFHLNPLGLPAQYMFTNYFNAYKELYITIESGRGTREVYLFEMIYNSLRYSIGTTFIDQIVTASVAYVCAKYPSFISRLIYKINIVTLILPIVGNLASALMIAKFFGWYDNMYGVWFTSGFSVTGTSLLIYYAVFKNLSWEYAEAAFLDGANHFKVLYKIMIPLIMPTMLALSLRSFIGTWNDWQGPMIWLPSSPTIAFGLYSFQFSTSTIASSTPMQLAGCSIVIFPMLVLFIAFKNKMIGSISFGGLKG